VQELEAIKNVIITVKEKLEKCTEKELNSVSAEKKVRLFAEVKKAANMRLEKNVLSAVEERTRKSVPFQNLSK
jgi:hypothetical protein